MNETFITALVAALVSFLVTLLAHFTEKHKIKSSEQRQKMEMRRRLTEKLLDLRLIAYPKAFEITDSLRGDLILKKGSNVSVDHVEGVLLDILDWHKSCAGFLLTRHSLCAYRAMKSALSVDPENEGAYSQAQKELMFRCKNKFRETLKSDLILIYQEDYSVQEVTFDG